MSNPEYLFRIIKKHDGKCIARIPESLVSRFFQKPWQKDVYFAVKTKHLISAAQVEATHWAANR